MFSVHKNSKTGRYRWVARTSSSFEDRDREFFPVKELQKAVDYATKNKSHGTLNWWHTDIVLGTCDFSMLYGKVLIESGEFLRNSVGKAFAEVSEKFGLSIGCWYETLKDNTYENIFFKERSLLPVGKESNLLAGLAVTTKENSDLSTQDLMKVSELVHQLGAPLAAKVLQDAEAIQKAVSCNRCFHGAFWH